MPVGLKASKDLAVARRLVTKIGRSGCGALVVLAVASAIARNEVAGRSNTATPTARPAVLRLNTATPGNRFAPGAVGLSVDANLLSADRLEGSDRSLIALMRLLGPAVLRIGGGSVDFEWWTSTGEPRPSWAHGTITPSDLRTLRGLLKATGWTTLLGVDLGHFEPARAANEALFAKKILGTSLIGIEVGNEPDGFGDKADMLRSPQYGVSKYIREAGSYAKALRAAAPGVPLYGPALSSTRWLPRIGASVSMFSVVTQHYYAAGSCSADPSAPAGAQLLTPAVRWQEDETLRALASAGAVARRPTRIGETNAVTCRGASAPASASALWALDWTLRAAGNGVSGLNFHGGLFACGTGIYCPICAPNEAAIRAGEVMAEPEYYGLLAARQLEGGRFVPTSPHPSLANLTSYATIARDGTLKIAIDNLAIAGPAQPMAVAVPGRVVATVEALAAGPVGLGNGISLGRATVNAVGKWRPEPTTERASHGFLTVVVPPASAVILTVPTVGHG